LKSFPLAPSQYGLPFLTGGQVLIHQKDLNLPQTHTKDRFLAVGSTLPSVTPASYFSTFFFVFLFVCLFVVCLFAVVCLGEGTDLLNKASSQGISAPLHAMQAQAGEQAR